MFLVPVLTGQIARLIGRSFGFDMTEPFAVTAVAAVMVIVQGIALVGLTLRHVTKPGGLDLSVRHIGVTADNWSREVGVGLLWGVGLLVANVVASQSARWVFRRLMSEEAFLQQLAWEGGDLPELIAAGMPAWIVVSFALASVVVAPVAEELFFRGYVHGVFRFRFPGHAVFWSSALFAFVHFYVIHLIPVFLIGVILAVLYERRGSLVAPIVAHAFSNLVVTASMIVQGISRMG